MRRLSDLDAILKLERVAKELDALAAECWSPRSERALQACAKLVRLIARALNYTSLENA